MNRSAGKRRRRLHWPILEMVLLVLGVLFVSPCFLALLNSFKTNSEILQNPLALPRKLNLDNYRYVFATPSESSPLATNQPAAQSPAGGGPTGLQDIRLTQGLALAHPMLNSALMCVAVIVLLITVAPMAAYSIMRRKMWTGRFLRLFFLVGLTIPFQVIMVPLLRLFRMLGISSGGHNHAYVGHFLGMRFELIGGIPAIEAFGWRLQLMHVAYIGLLLHYVSWGLPLCIFIYSAFMTTIPKELEEAAAIDGCGQVGTFWRVVFPLLTPCTVTVIIFWGLWIWNDFIQAFVIMGPDKGQLVFVQLWRLFGNMHMQRQWNHIFAAVVVLSAPVTALYVLMQRRFVKGLTAGSFK